MSLVNEQVRLEKSDILRDYLERNQYEKVAQDRYKKGLNEDVELYKEGDQLRYRNHLMPGDFGSLTQFIMNRLDKEQGIVPRNDLSEYAAAIQIALDFEKSISLKLNTNKAPRYIKDDASKRRKNKL